MDQITMNKTAIALAIVASLGLSACSTTLQEKTTGASLPPVATGPNQAISEQRLSSDFRRQGVKVIYTAQGEIEAIEAVGYAPVWGRSQNSAREAYRVAELEAKKALNDFINQETIRSNVSVAMISRNLEKARDNKTNDFATNRPRNADSEVSDVEVEQQVSTVTDDVNKMSNTALRNDALSIASRVNTTITAQNQGILSGLFLVEGTVIDDGRNVRAVYRWEARGARGRGQVRQLMMQ